jgi:hypothetical protein
MSQTPSVAPVVNVCNIDGIATLWADYFLNNLRTKCSLEDLCKKLMDHGAKRSDIKLLLTSQQHMDSVPLIMFPLSRVWIQIMAGDAKHFFGLYFTKSILIK